MQLASAVTNTLRKRGMLTEGYNIDRDAYELGVRLGPVLITWVRQNYQDLGFHRFTGSDKSVNGKSVKTPPQYKLMRLGMKPMYFSDVADMLARIRQVFDREGYESSPSSAPFVFYNQKSGKYTFFDPRRIEMLRPELKQLPFPG